MKLDLTFVPEAMLDKPRSGLHQVYLDFWWLVSEETGELAFRVSNRGRQVAPLCNAHEQVVRKVLQIDGLQARQVPQVFLLVHFFDTVIDGELGGMDFRYVLPTASVGS